MKNPIFIQKLLRQYYRTGWRGFYLLNKLLNRNGSIIGRNSYGALFELNPANYIDGYVLREGYYESEIIESVRKYAGEKFTFWDVGGNLGLHGLTVMKMYPGANVHIFEPLPKMCDRIHSNAELNDMTIHLHRFALMEADEERTLYTEETGTEGESSLQDNGRAKLDQTIKVPCFRADTLIQNGTAPMPNIVKIDVEGSESAVLQGFGKYLANEQLQLIIFEASNELIDREKENDIYALLTENGFVISRLERREQSAHMLSNYMALRLHVTDSV